MFANDSPPAVILSGAKELDVCIENVYERRGTAKVWFLRFAQDELCSVVVFGEGGGADV
jgi:hypothetical protein